MLRQVDWPNMVGTGSWHRACHSEDWRRQLTAVTLYFQPYLYGSRGFSISFQHTDCICSCIFFVMHQQLPQRINPSMEMYVQYKFCTVLCIGMLIIVLICFLYIFIILQNCNCSCIRSLLQFSSWHRVCIQVQALETSTQHLSADHHCIDVNMYTAMHHYPT